MKGADFSAPYFLLVASFGNSQLLCRIFAAAMLYGMRRLRNWTYRNVTDFLKESGFSFSREIRGSHQAWSRRLDEGDEIVVEINFTHKSYPPKTLKTMVNQSGIPAKEWIKWAGS